jgi:DNA-binding NtrC family response regulator
MTMADKIKILIVDDEKEFLESIAQRLELRDFEVTKASNGQEAIEAARKGRFDLALLDLKMPGIGGKQVLEVLRKEHKFLEVIIITGHGSIESAVDCVKTGAFGYLPKPYELEKLLDILKQAYESRLKKKFEFDQERMNKIAEVASGASPLGVLRELRNLDDAQK